uniref:Uncharacterized protein n=1 Tax=Tetranychus urticae TaxID=32264 RepID=T1KTB0_TETUR
MRLNEINIFLLLSGQEQEPCKATDGATTLNHQQTAAKI